MTSPWIATARALLRAGLLAAACSAFACGQGDGAASRDGGRPDASTDGEHPDAASDGGRPDPPPEPGPLCDGSDAIRFGYDSIGGWLTGAPVFLMRYGWGFLYVRGDCRYVADYPHNGEFRGGQLSPEQAEQLAREVGFASIGDWAQLGEGERTQGICHDAATTTLRGPAGNASCDCCRIDAMHAAVRGAQAASRRLWTAGTPIEAPVIATATAWEGATDGLPLWPLTSDIAEIVDPLSGSIDTPQGTRFDDPFEAAALRALRQQAHARNTDAYGFAVRDQDGATYAVQLADDLPADMAGAVRAIRAGD